jgi:hypothetical protein
MQIFLSFPQKNFLRTTAEIFLKTQLTLLFIYLQKFHIGVSKNFGQ